MSTIMHTSLRTFNSGCSRTQPGYMSTTKVLWQPEYQNFSQHACFSLCIRAFGNYSCTTTLLYQRRLNGLCWNPMFVVKMAWCVSRSTWVKNAQLLPCFSEQWSDLRNRKDTPLYDKCNLGSYSSKVSREARFVSQINIIHIIKWLGLETDNIIKKCDQSLSGYGFFCSAIKRNTTVVVEPDNGRVITRLRYAVQKKRSNLFGNNLWPSIINFFIDIAKVITTKNTCDGEGVVFYVKQIKCRNCMLLFVGHQVDESDIYKMLTLLRDAANMFITTILHLLCKLMMKKGVTDCTRSLSNIPQSGFSSCN